MTTMEQLQTLQAGIATLRVLSYSTHTKKEDYKMVLDRMAKALNGLMH